MTVVVNRPPARPPEGGGLPPLPESWLPNEHNLYRPRHSPRQRTALVCALLFFLAPALAYVVGVRAQPFENRDLHAFPDPSAGWSFFTGLSGWATDHLPLRQAGVAAAEGVSTGVFGDPPGSGYSSSPGPVGVSPQAPQQPGTPAEEDRRRSYPIVVSGKNDWIYLGQDVSYKCRPTMHLDEVIGKLQRLRSAVESSGRRFELLIAPDKLTAAPQNLPDNYVGEDCARERSTRLWQRAVAELNAIDVRDDLHRVERRLGHSVYDAKDTHWSYAGGMTMTRVLAEQLAPGVTSSWQVTPGELRPWPADIPPLLGRSEKRQLRRYSLAPDGTTDLTRYVASDFRVPLHLVQSPADRAVDGTVQGRVGLIADSFTQFASPFLAAALEDMLIVHPETMAENPAGNTARLLVDREVIVVELAERHVAGGASQLLRDGVIDRIAGVLRENPR